MKSNHVISTRAKNKNIVQMETILKKSIVRSLTFPLRYMREVSPINRVDFSNAAAYLQQVIQLFILK